MKDLNLLAVAAWIAACAPVSVFASAIDESTKTATPEESSKVVAAQPQLPVVKRSDKPAAETRDGRVNYGGFTISRPRWEGEAGATRTGSAPAVDAGESTRMYIPDNTMGPGEAHWQQRARENAALRLAEAEADAAERDAEIVYESDYAGYPIYGPHGPRRSHWYGLPVYRGRAGTVQTFDGDLHGRAQREFFDASYPSGMVAVVEGQADAQRQFSETARPRINQIESDRASAQIQIRKDKFAQPRSK